jgi:hypothetical protein
MIYKTLHRKLTIKHHEPHKNRGWTQMLLKGKKSLKIPKGLSDSLNRRRTDNTMDKKTPKTMIYKILHRKLTIKHHERHKNQGWAQMLLKGKKSLKIRKGLSESVNRRTDNTMDKKTKNKDLQNTTQKTNDKAPWTPQKPGLSSDALKRQEEFEDIKGVFRKFKWKDKQYIHLISLKTACL